MTTDPGAMVVIEDPGQLQPRSVFGTDDPRAIMARVSEVATPLAEFIEARGMLLNMGQSKYVLADGWSFMGAMLGVSPRTTEVRELRNPEGDLVGYEAYCELTMRDGSVCGGAWAECTRTEPRWSWNPVGRDGNPISPQPDFALKSMAQTRAMGKAFRMSLGFVMRAAGYESTPAEEAEAEFEGSTARAPAPRNSGGTPRQQGRPPRAPAPPQPRAPEWVEELRQQMGAQRVTPREMLHFLGQQGNVLEWHMVNAWLDANEGKGVADLVIACAEAKEASSAEAR